MKTGRDAIEAKREKGYGEPSRHFGEFETCVPGVFAVGDLRHGGVKRVASAVGEGSAVVRQVLEFLEGELRRGRCAGRPPRRPADPAPPSGPLGMSRAAEPRVQITEVVFPPMRHERLADRAIETPEPGSTSDVYAFKVRAGRSATASPSPQPSSCTAACPRDGPGAGRRASPLSISALDLPYEFHVVVRAVLADGTRAPVAAVTGTRAALPAATGARSGTGAAHDDRAQRLDRASRTCCATTPTSPATGRGTRRPGW